MKPIPADLSTWSSIVEIVASLRARDGGCPWDLEQTHRTLIPFAIEEVYELAEALEAEDQASTIEELGDVLLQVLLHAQIASETTVESNRYSWRDVVRTLGEKMVRRHPHVFGESNVAKSAETSEQVLAQWQVIKSQEKINSENKKAKSFFNIPIAMPALQRSFKIGEKTNRLKFDWPDWKGALAKVEEELVEVKEAIDKFGSAEVEHEIGDLLFSIDGNIVGNYVQLTKESYPVGISMNDVCDYKVTNKVLNYDLVPEYSKIKILTKGEIIILFIKVNIVKQV